MEVQIKKLELTNYRNIPHVVYEFDGNSKIVGENKVGKTNSLESIYYLLTDKLLDGSVDIAQIKPLSNTKEKVMVEGLFLVNGKEIKLKKVYYELWSKKLNSKTYRFFDYLFGLVIVNLITIILSIFIITFSHFRFIEWLMLMEETFFKIITKKPRFTAKHSFKTWLYTIGRNAAIDYLRHNSKQPDISTDDIEDYLKDGHDLEKMYIIEERRIAVHKVLRKLHPEYRQVLWLLYFEDFSNTDTAAIMKKNTRQMKNLVYRAKNALKSELEKEGFIYEEL